MTNLVQQIQRIVKNALEAERPTDIQYGRVVSKDPFQIQLEQRLILEKGFFIVQAGMTTDRFEVGDKLILIRKRGGQKYLIFGKEGAL